MVRLEDIEYERSVTERVSCFAVPVEVTLNAGGGDPDVLTYRICRDLADEYYARFAEDPCSDGARDFLEKGLRPVMDSVGYSPVYEPFEFRKEFTWDREASPRRVVLDGCRIIGSLEGLRFDEELPAEEYRLFPDIPSDRMAVVERDGKVVCFAGVNDMSAEGACEINVECAPGYRNKGYAASCVSALAAYLSGIGEKVVYVCSDSNTASERTALRAGFTYSKTVMSFVCVKNEREGPEEIYGI